MNKLMIPTFLAFFIISNASYATSADINSALKDASANGRFLFLTFYQEKDAALTNVSSVIADFRKSSSKKTAVFDAAISDPANKEMADQYDIRTGKLPLLLVIAPNGVVTGGFPGSAVTAEQLKKSVSLSDLMLNVLKPLKEQKVVLVALQNAATKFNEESWAGVADFANDANYKNFVSAIKADPMAPGGQDFVKQCNLIEPITQATVVILLPPGRIGNVITGKTTKNELLKALQACAGGCSDRRFKENVEPIVSALEKTAKLQGVTFTWNRDTYPERFFSPEPHIGLIAQDVEAVIPEVVQTDADGYKRITYDKLTALLIEAVKELKQKIDAQASLIQEQNARIKVLEEQ